LPALLLKTFLDETQTLLQGQVSLRREAEKNLVLEVLLITPPLNESQRQLELFFKEHLRDSETWFEEAELADRRVLKIGQPFSLL